MLPMVRPNKKQQSKASTPSAIVTLKMRLAREMKMAVLSSCTPTVAHSMLGSLLCQSSARDLSVSRPIDLLQLSISHKRVANSLLWGQLSSLLTSSSKMKTIKRFKRPSLSGSSTRIKTQNLRNL